MIRVLIVDDSVVHQKLISFALRRHADIEVVGTAENPYVARDLINRLNPDVITLDLQMPRMDGLTFLGKMMVSHPLPVIIISSYTPKDSSNALKALSMGAIDTISKPGLEYDLKEFSALLIQMVRGAAKANVRPLTPGKRVTPTTAKIANAAQKIIAIGSSTGGTRALEFLLKQLPTGLPGIVIVQHLPESFTNNFASRLNMKSAITVKEAADHDEILPGHAYIAKGNHHLVIQRKAGKAIARLSNAEPVNYHRPSADVLFNSVASEFGSKATGVILTGMGSDGADGLLNMKQNGAFTIGQDEATSVVYGMPKAAFEMGAVCDQLALDDIPDRIIDNLKQHMRSAESNARLRATSRY
jgi:two-component system chemotaxis response regulator CheB